MPCDGRPSQETLKIPKNAQNCSKTGGTEPEKSFFFLSAFPSRVPHHCLFSTTSPSVSFDQLTFNSLPQVLALQAATQASVGLKLDFKDPTAAETALQLMAKRCVSRLLASPFFSEPVCVGVSGAPGPQRHTPLAPRGMAAPFWGEICGSVLYISIFITYISILVLCILYISILVLYIYC